MATATATIVYDVAMGHWPPDSTLVKVNPPLKTFDRLTGKQVDHPYIAVQVPRPGMAETEASIYPSTKSGEFVEATMQPIPTGKSGLLHTVLKQLGYDVAN